MVYLFTYVVVMIAMFVMFVGALHAMVKWACRKIESGFDRKNNQ